MRYDRTPTDRSDNFERRLRVTRDSELEPEQVTPNTAGAEELPEYQDTFPLTRQLKQTNMHGRRGKTGDQSGSGRDQQG
jgi:hypothetical protein